MHSQCPPPKRFVAAVEVRDARFLPKQPPFIRRGRSFGRFAVGVRYELEVGQYLELWALGKEEVELKLGAWLEFTDRGGKPRWCQVDAAQINHSRKTCLIAEIKYQHTSDAWWQLKWLYLPVLQGALPGYSFSLLEIVHWHDPGVVFPEPYQIIGSIDDARCDNTVRVLILNPRRLTRLSGVGHTGSEGSRA